MNANHRADFVDRARRESQQLTSLDLTAPLDDLEPLAAIVGKARIVGVGESWHHAHEILKLKFRLVRFLVERLGFNTLIFEGSLPGSERVDGYVRGGTSSPSTALRAFGQPMWLNAETVEFIEWLREHNAKTHDAQRVHIYGMDVGYPAAAIFGVLAYLERIDPGYQIPHRQQVMDLGSELQKVRFGSLTKSAMYGSSDVFDKLSAGSKEQFLAAFIDIAARLQTHGARYAFASSVAELEQVRRYAILVIQAHGAISVRSSDLRLANDRRDAAFAENIQWIVDRIGGGARVVVLAHNLHVSRGTFRSNPPGRAITSMGGYLSDWYKEHYVAIGTAVGQGRIVGGGPGLVRRPPEGAASRRQFDDSTDAALENVGKAHFLLAIPADSPWTQQSKCLRCHFDPQPEYALAAAFDALTYIDRIEQATPLVFDDDGK